MRLKYSILIIAIFISYTFYSQDISEKTARIVANNFLNQRIQLKNSNHNKLINITNRFDKKYDGFYIFKSLNGFIIISSQSENHPILAYSFDTTLNPEGNQSPEFLYFLREYQSANEYLRKSKIKKIGEDKERSLIKEEWDALLYRKEMPLSKMNHKYNEIPLTKDPLITTKWSQNTFYNKLVPKTYENQSCLTGCVATTMAQIMKYWNYPVKGKSSNTYKIQNTYYDWKGKTLTADFANTTYLWNNMPTSLSLTSTTQQIDAVATLMLHTGISVNMIYGPNSSGAFNNSVLKALKNYFQYSSDVKMVNKGNYSNFEWIKLIKDQLIKNYPVFYKGSNRQGAHTFIADGIDSNNLIHFNFGWGGYADGYFQLSEPAGYKSNQSAIINIHPINYTCSIPSGLTTSNISSTGVVLKWNNIPGILSYTIEYKTNKEENWNTKTLESNDTLYTLTGLKPNTSYSWRVKANCYTSNSSNYAQSTFNTLIYPTPTHLSAYDITSNSAILKWDEMPGVSNYTVEYKSSLESTWTTAAIATTNTFFLLSKLNANTTYNWRVKANYSDSISSNFEENSFRTSTNCAANYEPNDSFETAYPININTLYSAALGSSYDLDYYKFSIYKKSTIEIILKNFSEHYTLALYDSSKNYITRSTNTENNKDQFQINLIPGTYYIMVKGYKDAFLENKCYDLIVNQIFNDKITDNNNIIIYPNPAHETLNIKGVPSNIQKFITLTIFDNSGKLVKNVRLLIEDKISINVSDLQPNLYIIKILGKNYKFIKK